MTNVWYSVYVNLNDGDCYNVEDYVDAPDKFAYLGSVDTFEDADKGAKELVSYLQKNGAGDIESVSVVEVVTDDNDDINTDSIVEYKVN